jgi:Lon protease-like protein
MAAEPDPDFGPNLALFPLAAPLYPGALLPLHIFETRYRLLVRDLVEASQAGAQARFGVVSIRAGHEVGADAATSLADVGCSALLRRVVELPDGRFEVVATAERRFELQHVQVGPHGYLQAQVRWLDDEPDDQQAQEGLAASVRDGLSAYLLRLGGSDASVDLPDEPAALAFAAPSTMVLSNADRQRVLSAGSTAERLRIVLGFLVREEALLDSLGAVPATDLLRIAPTLN